jgi:hypothetical protein
VESAGLAECRRILGQIAQERARFPKGVIKATTDGAFLGRVEYDRFQEWTCEELDRFDEVLTRVFPGALPKR